MSNRPNRSHPAWCHPATCVDHGAEHDTVEHRSAGVTWKPNAADVEITVCTSAGQEYVDFVHGPDPARVLLHALDLGSTQPDGRDIEIDIDLTTADARMLAAILVAEAERVDALARRAVMSR